MKHYILRYGEIFLKGKNRYEFVRKLAKNIQSCLKREKIEGKLEKVGARFLLEAAKEPPLRRVFGLISYSECVKVRAKQEDIEKEVLKIAKKLKKGTKFRISTQKSSKSFSSMELNQKLGEAVVNAYGLPVDLKNFDVDIGIDILGDRAYVFSETKKCLGGLPLGSEGSLAALIDDKNSILAALLIMRRGCAVFPFAFKKQDISLLEKYSYGQRIELRIVKDISELNEIIKEYSLKALVTGQGLEGKELEIEVPELRPLLAFSESKLAEMSVLFDRR
ncbi:MAG: THUMP domain-containing protein [archaeon]